jgi:hypothetical protein
MKRGCWLAVALLVAPIARAQQLEIVQPAGTGGNELLSKPIGVAREVAATARDFVTLRDSQWSGLTMAQIGAASADAVTSLNNFHSCPSCLETGVSRFFVGQHPDAHKYIIGGAIEIGVEAVTAHYFRNHGPTRKWYWRTLWALPQSLSLYEHARAARQNTLLDLKYFSAATSCK